MDGALCMYRMSRQKVTDFDVLYRGLECMELSGNFFPAILNIGTFDLFRLWVGTSKRFRPKSKFQNSKISNFLKMPALGVFPFLYLLLGFFTVLPNQKPQEQVILPALGVFHCRRLLLRFSWCCSIKAPQKQWLDWLLMSRAVLLQRSEPNYKSLKMTLAHQNL